MKAGAYPSPPWHTHGEAWACSFVVPTASLSLPRPLEPASVGGRSLGVLAYVRYLPPSPLVYDELIWMPTLAREPGGLRGFWVGAMYVDSQASLEGGRGLWALPKRLARFEREGKRVTVSLDDGTRVELVLEAKGPAIRAPQRVRTLQTRDGEVVVFEGSGRGAAGLARVEIEAFSSPDPGWAGFEVARRAGPAARLEGFSTTMHPPRLASGRGTLRLR